MKEKSRPMKRSETTLVGMRTRREKRCGFMMTLMVIKMKRGPPLPLRVARRSPRAGHCHSFIVSIKVVSHHRMSPSYPPPVSTSWNPKISNIYKFIKVLRFHSFSPTPLTNLNSNTSSFMQRRVNSIVGSILTIYRGGYNVCSAQ